MRQITSPTRYAIVAIATLATVTTWADSPPRAAAARIEAIARARGVQWPMKDVNIAIRTVSHEMDLRSGEQVVVTYRVSLGAEPGVAKVREGDHRTPHGSYYVCTRNDRSAFRLFLGISYPSAADAARGLASGLITKRQYDAIVRANARKQLPPWGTALGGTVGIHGGGVGSDWTWGCIAVENSEIEELWAVCPLGTPVVIGP
jgi:L,D-peptidoglycan transpeptidase YkuD (ErfK/YbiS/YcfS/YnhG family)